MRTSCLPRTVRSSTHLLVHLPVSMCVRLSIHPFVCRSIIFFLYLFIYVHSSVRSPSWSSEFIKRPVRSCILLEYVTYKVEYNAQYIHRISHRVILWAHWKSMASLLHELVIRSEDGRIILEWSIVCNSWRRSHQSTHKLACRRHMESRVRETNFFSVLLEGLSDSRCISLSVPWPSDVDFILRGCTKCC